jgi:hypothetical protein
MSSERTETTPIGVPGLDHSGGLIREELNPNLKGGRAMAVYEEMSENDATIGAGLYSIEGFLRRLVGDVEPSIEGDATAEAEAEFVESCMNDMSRPWGEFIADTTLMLRYGFSIHETYYKIRRGPHSKSKRFKSRFSDNRVGWGDIATRAQKSIDRWDIDPHTGEIYGCYQRNPVDHSVDIYLPMDRCVLFRTSAYKNSPEGRSVLRPAFRAWYFKKRLEEVEAIGLNRSLVNTLVYELPPRFMSANATAEEKAVRAGAERTVSLLSKDRLTGLVIPAELDTQGKPTGYKVRLLNASATQLSTDPVIRRYDVRILQVLAAEFLALGTEKTGSFAMAVEKNTNFVRSLERFADIVAAQINTVLIPELMKRNGVDEKYWPRFCFKPIDKVDVAALGLFMSQVGDHVQHTLKTENALRERAQLPPLSEEEWAELEAKAEEAAAAELEAATKQPATMKNE